MPNVIMDKDINYKLLKFLRGNARNVLAESKCQNSPSILEKDINSIARGYITEAVTCQTMDEKMIETIENCFKSIHIIKKPDLDDFDDIKKYQVFIIKLIEFKKIDRALDQLAILRLYIMDLVNSEENYHFAGTIGSLLTGVTFNKSIEGHLPLQMIGLVIAFHFLVLQSILQYVSSNIKVIAAKTDPLFNLTDLSLVANFYLSRSNFMKWLRCCEDVSISKKYEVNSIKLLKSFLKLCDALERRRACEEVTEFKTSLLIKLAQFERDHSYLENIQPLKAHIPFIEDLADVGIFNIGLLLSKIHHEGDIQACVLRLLKSPTLETMDNLKISLLSGSRGVLSDGGLFSFLANIDYKHNQFTLDFMLLLTSIIRESISNIECLSKNQSYALDKITLFLKDSIKLNEPESCIAQILNDLFNIYANFTDVKRMRNCSNLLYNLGNSTKIKSHWITSFEHEIIIVNMDPDHDLSYIRAKVNKISFSLIDGAYYEESVKVLLSYFKLVYPMSYSSDDLYVNFQKHGDTPIFRLLAESLLAKPALCKFMMMNITESLGAFLVIRIMGYLGRSTKFKSAEQLCNALIENARFQEKKLEVLVHYHYYISSGNVSMIDYRDLEGTDNLVMAGIYLQRAGQLNWEENLLSSISCLESHLSTCKSSSISVSTFELDVTKCLLGYLALNKLEKDIIHLARLYRCEKRNPGTEETVIILEHECAALLKVDDPKSASDTLTLLGAKLKSADGLSLRNILWFNLLQFEFCLLIENSVMAKEKFNRVLRFIQSKEEFSLNASHQSLVDKLSNLLLISKFHLLTSKLNSTLGNYMESYANCKTSMKLLYSITKSLSSDISRPALDLLRWDSIRLLFEAYQSMNEVLICLGVSRDFLFYVEEFKKLDGSTMAPVTNSLNNAKFFAYELLLKNKKSMEESHKRIEEQQVHTIVSNDKRVSLVYNLTKFFDRSILNETYGNYKVNDHETDSQYNAEARLEFAYLASLEDWRLQVIRDKYSRLCHHSQLLNIILESKKNLSVIEASNLSSYERVDILSSVQSLPAITSEGTVDQNYAILEALDLLANIKNFTFGCITSPYFHCLSPHEVKDLANVMTNCLTLMSTISIFRNNSNFLWDLCCLQEIPRYLVFNNERKLSHTSKKDFFPNPISSEERISFEQASHALQEDFDKYFPSHWSATSIDVCPYTGGLIITKFERFSDPVCIKLPLDRSRSTRSAFKSMTFEQLTERFHAIISQSDLSTRSSTTRHVQSKEDRKKWWKLRFSLDSDVDSLLTHVESSWLGGFKSLFCRRGDEQSFSKYKTAFLKLMHLHLPSRRNRTSPINLDNNLIWLFHNLKENEENDLNDLLHYFLDELSIHGEVNHLSTTEFEKLRHGLKRISQSYGRQIEDDEHLVLILGSECTFFPWESLSCLKGKSVSRMPSLKLTLDFLKKQESQMSINNPDNLYYVINPGGDLERTENNFKPLFSESKYWKGSIGKIPDDSDLINSIITKDLFVYLGHGGCEQYLNLPTLFKACLPNERTLPPSLIIGCSSGSLQTNGFLNPTGNIYNLLTCGSPMVVVNLWNVTDKDIDLFTLSLLTKWGLLPGSEETMNICRAVDESRSSCYLKHLNGAAPVVYGLPLHLK